MMYPPSLPADVKVRAFRTGNGELGILPTDAPAFLAACRSDGVEVQGWELWLVGHRYDVESHQPMPAEGEWCGLIPMNKGDFPAILGGEGDLDETERQLAKADFEAEVQPAWRPHLRVNFAFSG